MYHLNIENAETLTKIKKENREVTLKVMLERNMKTEPWILDKALITCLDKNRKKKIKPEVPKFDGKGVLIVE